jgi:hypothetical protein
MIKIPFGITALILAFPFSLLGYRWESLPFLLRRHCLPAWRWKWSGMILYIYSKVRLGFALGVFGEMPFWSSPSIIVSCVQWLSAWSPSPPPWVEAKGGGGIWPRFPDYTRWCTSSSWCWGFSLVSLSSSWQGGNGEGFELSLIWCGVSSDQSIRRWVWRGLLPGDGRIGVSS